MLPVFKLPKKITVKTNEKNHAVFVFILEIEERKHEFRSTYSKLNKLHESFKKDENILNLFNNKIPSFPSKNIFKDYTKLKNYKKLSNQLLIYFKSLISNPSILSNDLFKNGIKYKEKTLMNTNKLLKLKQSTTSTAKHDSECIAFHVFFNLS